jgi:two-component sensor histidine kinase
MLDLHDAADTDIVAPPAADKLRKRPGEWDDLLFDEAHHRIKNTLALLIAFLHQDFALIKLPDIGEAIARYENRLLAFGDLYGLLAAGCESGRIYLGQHIERLTKALTVAILEPIGLRCEVSVENGFLASKRCERLGLIITELVINAAKHAFPQSEDGFVRVEAIYHDGGWRCTVSDNGIGAMGSPRGIGSRILQSLARSIRARTTIESGRCGTSVTIWVPD